MGKIQCLCGNSFQDDEAFIKHNVDEHSVTPSGPAMTQPQPNKTIDSEVEELKRLCPDLDRVEVAKLLKWAAQEANKARIDEILMMRAVGDATAIKPGTGFEELAAAYDNHILKRAADLTTPELTADKEQA